MRPSHHSFLCHASLGTTLGVLFYFSGFLNSPVMMVLNLMFGFDELPRK